MIHLGAFGCHVFTTFSEVYDHDGTCRSLKRSSWARESMM